MRSLRIGEVITADDGTELVAVREVELTDLISSADFTFTDGTHPEPCSHLPNGFVAAARAKMMEPD